MKAQPKVTRKTCFAMSVVTNLNKRSKRKRNCQDALLSELSTRSVIPEFKSTSLRNVEFKVQSGVFGEVSVCEIKFSGLKCARKTIKGTMADLRAEALVMQLFSGHENFPLFYGLSESGAILMEYISSNPNRLSCSKSLRSAVKSKILSIKTWYDICRELIDALKFMHSKSILHNDIHGDNILLRYNNSPCMIDFGKSTLSSSPLIYDIIPGSKEHKYYNTHHLHLAHELRNIPNSPQTFSTDIYSLGYLFKIVGKHQNIQEITYLGHKMTKDDQYERYSLVDCSVHLLK